MMATEPPRYSVIDIDLPHACYWVGLRDGIVIKAPPIARWMIGKSQLDVVDWVRRKGGTPRIDGREAFIGIRKPAPPSSG